MTTSPAEPERSRVAEIALFHRRCRMLVSEAAATGEANDAELIPDRNNTGIGVTHHDNPAGGVERYSYSGAVNSRWVPTFKADGDDTGVQTCITAFRPDLAGPRVPPATKRIRPFDQPYGLGTDPPQTTDAELYRAAVRRSAQHARTCHEDAAARSTSRRWSPISMPDWIEVTRAAAAGTGIQAASTLCRTRTRGAFSLLYVILVPDEALAAVLLTPNPAAKDVRGTGNDS